MLSSVGTCECQCSDSFSPATIILSVDSLVAFGNRDVRIPLYRKQMLGFIEVIGTNFVLLVYNYFKIHFCSIQVASLLGIFLCQLTFPAGEFNVCGACETGEFRKEKYRIGQSCYK